MKNNLSYKLIKLNNGEDIICTMDTDISKLKQNDKLYVVDPVLVIRMRYPKGMSMVEGYVFQPWVSYASQSVFEIPAWSVVTFADLEDKIKDTYIRYITEEIPNNVVQKTIDSETQMSKEEAAKLADMLSSISMLKDDEDAEEETTSPRGRRTLH
jgi:hypothetical protein